MAGRQLAVKVDEHKDVKQWSAQIFSVHGNPPLVEVAPLDTVGCIFTTFVHGIADMKEVWNNFSGLQKAEFVRRFGNLAGLLDVSVNVNALNAAFIFWDPTYRCFSFNAVELTPTIEEYSELMKAPESAEGRVYSTDRRLTEHRVLSRVIGEYDSEGWKGQIRSKGESRVVSADLLIKFTKKNMDCDKGLTLLALCIYGLILYPKVRGYIDVKVVKLFLQVQIGVNPIIPILAETIRSLDFCREHGKGKFIGCTQLLFVWLQSHLKYPKDFPIRQVTFSNAWDPERNPIAESAVRSGNPNIPDMEMWKSFFATMNYADVTWKASWLPQKTMIYRCDKYHNVPLLGPWGVTCYAPLMALRQMAMDQFVPVVNSLRELDCSYDKGDYIGKVQAAVEAWKIIRKINDDLDCTTATRDHRNWLVAKKTIEPPKKGKEKMIEPEQCPVNEEEIQPKHGRQDQVDVDHPSRNEGRRAMEPGKCSFEGHSEQMTGVSTFEKIEELQKEIGLWKKRSLKEREINSILRKEKQESDYSFKRWLKLAKRAERTNDSLEKDIKARDDRIAKLEGTVDSFKRLVVELDVLVEDKRGQIVENEEDICSLKKIIEKLEYRLTICQSSAEKVVATNRQLQEQRKNIQIGAEQLQHQNEAQLFYINNALNNLRLLTRRARSLAAWGTNLQGNVTQGQPNGEELMEFLRTICRELRFLGQFM